MISSMLIRPFAAIVLSAALALAQDPDGGAARGRPLTAHRPAVPGVHGLVAAGHPLAAIAGLQMLMKGGNAIDAAVAVGAALNMMEPQMNGIGGNGFMIVFDKKTGRVYSLSMAGAAPQALKPETMTPDTLDWGIDAGIVPGNFGGYLAALERFGTMSLAEVLAPAIDYAQNGYPIDASLATAIARAKSKLEKFPTTANVFLPGGRAPQPGELFRNRDLAATLRKAVAAEKAALSAKKTRKDAIEAAFDRFYRGDIAREFDRFFKENHGALAAADLAAYKPQWTDPVHSTYRGYDVYGAPPPSSGGTCLVEMLNILENFDLRKQGRWSPETMHLMIEAMRRAYCDRARHLGDPAFAKIPAHLTDKAYARSLAQGISRYRATRSEDLAKDIPLTQAGDSTTHFSVIDKDGMAVANTYTLERSYGSRIVVQGAGFLLNNEMGDFNWQPGVTTRGGTIGTDANLIAPGKRMLSSQTPTILAKNGKAVLITGSPGSRTIINTVLSIVVNVVDFDMDIGDAVAAPRLHHQWFPDAARFEGMHEHAETIKKLRAMGHQITGVGTQGDAHSIWIDPKTGLYHGAADRRIDGKAAGY